MDYTWNNPGRVKYCSRGGSTIVFQHSLEMSVISAPESGQALMSFESRLWILACMCRAFDPSNPMPSGSECPLVAGNLIVCPYSFICCGV